MAVLLAVIGGYGVSGYGARVYGDLGSGWSVGIVAGVGWICYQCGVRV